MASFAQDLPAEARRDEIVTIVEQREYCVIADLAVMFGVSPMTIRRDLARLAQEHKVLLAHGVVRSIERRSPRIGDFSKRALTRRVEKTQIAQRALDFVKPRAVIALDAGSTVVEMARSFPLTADARVVTGSLAVIEALLGHKKVEITTLGGMLRRETRSFVGSSAVAAVAQLRFRTLFLGAASLSARGAFDVTDLDASVSRAMVQVADQVVVLADSSKFDQSAMSRICDWRSVDVLITDDGIRPADRQELAAQGVEIVAVPARESSSAASEEVS